MTRFTAEAVGMALTRVRDVTWPNWHDDAGLEGWDFLSTGVLAKSEIRMRYSRALGASPLIVHGSSSLRCSNEAKRSTS